MSRRKEDTAMNTLTRIIIAAALLSLPACGGDTNTEIGRAHV